MKTIKHLFYNPILVQIAISATISMIFVCAAHGQAIDCNDYGNPPNLNNLKSEEIRQLQQRLILAGYDDIPEDGVVGELTIAALQDYCKSRRSGDETVSYQITENKLEAFALAKTSYEALIAMEPGEDKKAVAAEVEEILSPLAENFDPPFVQKVYSPTVQNADGMATAAEALPPMYRPNDAILNRLKKRIIPDPVIEAVTDLIGKEFTTTALLDNAVLTKLIGKLKDDECASAIKMQTENEVPYAAVYTEVRNKVHQKFREPHDINSVEQIRWTSSPCGCVPDLTKETYGLYPFWSGALSEGEQAENTGEKKAQPPAILFGVLTRIGYYNLFMNSDGNLQKNSLWKNNKHRAGFINKAHKYRTKVDLVITMPDWRIWYARVENTTYREQMIKKITEVVTSAPKFDGVTLHFNTYPQDTTQAEALRAFLIDLRSRLSDHKKDTYLNLMLPPILKNSKKEKNEEKIRQFFWALYPKDQDFNDFSNPADLIITFLYEPTSCWKKEVRYIMEKMYKGETRKKMIRKIVPVIQLPQGSKNKQEIDQFKDDLIYFEDNFGGVGFWPAPSNQYEGLDLGELSALIVSAFELKENLPFLQRTLKNRTQSLCRFICPNRKTIKIIFFSILIFLSAYTAGSSWLCELRGLFNRFFWSFMAIILLEVIILCGLLACDPFLMKNSTEIFIILVVVLIIFLVFRQIRKMKEAEYP